MDTLTFDKIELPQNTLFNIHIYIINCMRLALQATCSEHDTAAVAAQPVFSFRPGASGFGLRDLQVLLKYAGIKII